MTRRRNPYPALVAVAQAAEAARNLPGGPLFTDELAAALDALLSRVRD